jgi:hypothetical protein
MICSSCGNEFLQPFVCTTCGAQKLRDETVKALEAEIAALIQKYADAVAENAALQGELAKAKNEADAMDEFLSAASRHEKEASAIINSLTADITIIVPFRDYTEMSPKDCYELGMMDGVAALKTQINAAIDAVFIESRKVTT